MTQPTASELADELEALSKGVAFSSQADAAFLLMAHDNLEQILSALRRTDLLAAALLTFTDAVERELDQTFSIDTRKDGCLGISLAPGGTDRLGDAVEIARQALGGEA